MKTPLPHRQAGLTLVELMVAMTLGLLILAGIGSLFVASKRSNRQNDQLAGMQDQARFALATLSRDLTMAGYWGGMSNAASIDLTRTGPSNLAAANDCGASATTAWAYALTTTVSSGTPPVTSSWPNRLEFRNQTDTTTTWNCLNHVVSGTDVVALRRVAGQQAGSMATSTSAAPALAVNNFFLKTNGVVGSMIRSLSTDVTETAAQPLTAPITFYKYVPRIYFVRDFARTVGDRTPALCRKELCPSGYTSNADPELASCGGTGTTAGMVSECLADGVEDLQIVWGVDSDDNGVIDRYTSTPTAQQVARQALSAQITLRIRSASGDASYNDAKTYTAGDATAFTPSTFSDPTGTPENQKAKHFYRRVYSTTVNLRNPAR